MCVFISRDEDSFKIVSMLIEVGGRELQLTVKSRNGNTALHEVIFNPYCYIPDPSSNDIFTVLLVKESILAHHVGG